MMRRYMRVGGGGKTFIGTFFLSNTLDSSTAQTATYTSVIQGSPGAIVTTKVTTLAKSNPSGVYKIDGATYFQDDEIPFTLDITGHVSMTQFIDVGTATIGNGINAVLTIIATTNGRISIPPDTSISKTT